MDRIVSLLGVLGIGGLLGSLIANWLTKRREENRRRAEFWTRQLEEFYGPLLSLHKEIRARSQLRVKIQEAIDQRHFRDMVRAAQPNDIEAASDAHLPAILRNIQDETQTFAEVLMPRYRELIDVFRNKMWLAEPETRIYFPALVEFVDVWDKILTNRVSREIAPAIGHTEESLKPFYSHLEAIHDRLRAKLSA